MSSLPGKSSKYMVGFPASHQADYQRVAPKNWKKKMNFLNGFWGFVSSFSSDSSD